MARPGPAPKHERERRNQAAELVVVPGGGMAAPEPGEWLPETAADWDAYWGELEATAVTPASLPALVRMFDLRDEVARLMAAVRDVGRFVEGSQGQTVVNPAYRVVTSLLAEVRQLEDRYALNPEAGLKLRVRAVEGSKTLDDLNRAAAEAAALAVAEAEEQGASGE